MNVTKPDWLTGGLTLGLPERLPTSRDALGASAGALLPLQEVHAFLLSDKEHTKYSDIAELIKSLDADADGQIDIMEFTAAALDTRLLLDDEKLRAVFAHMDKNKDGHLSMAELLAQLDGDPMVYDLMSEGDANGDGRLSLDEFRRVMKARVTAAKATSAPEAPTAAATVASTAPPSTVGGAE